ncbi:hypothetical protein HK096_008603 [Nowakowskiella sp. JEL0078]|nr:hypothetical protein HK096_008603 [Nowakowskiella sp. JEL0078]
MEVSKQFTLAVLLPDNKLSNQVQFLRSKFENSATFSRWPPHLNLLYPFLTLSLESSEQQVKLLDDLSTICSNFKPIRLRLNRLGVFQRETGASTIFLEPQGNSKSTDAKYDEDCRCAPDSESDVNGFQSLCELQSLLELAVSRFVDISKKRKFHPHMTIGSAVSKVLDESRKVIKETLSILDPTDFDIVIDTIYIMSKNYMVHENVPEDRFYIVSELPLSRKLNYIPSILPSSSFNQPSLSAELLKRKRQTPDIKPKKHINEFESESFQTSESQATFYDRSLLTFNIKLLTYNILYSSKDFSVSDSDSEISSKDEIRFQYILEMLENSEADIIVLQEYTEIFEKYLAKSNLLTSGAYVSSGYQKDLAYGSTVMLSRLPFSQTNEYLRLPISPGKEAVFTEFVLSGLKYDGNSETAIIRVAGVHLTSDYSGNKHAKRTEQIQNVNQILSQPDLFSKSEVKSTNMPVISVIIGDLNDEGDEVIPQGFVDITRSSGPTFDALCNPYALATAQKKNDRGYRLDRVLLRTSALIGSDDPYLGKNRFCWWRVETNLLGNGISGKIASDHFALSTKLQFAVLKAKEEGWFINHIILSS